MADRLYPSDALRSSGDLNEDKDRIMRRVIVSGITGHLGRELAQQLSEAGFEVHGLTRRDARPLGFDGDTVRLHRVDGTTRLLIEIVTSVRPCAVIHLAALARREHLESDLDLFINANVLFGTQLLEAMRACDCRLFVTAGSYLQHLDTDGYRAVNFYAATKQAFEAILEYYADAFRFAAIRLTLGDIYSEHDTRPKLMTDLAMAWRTQTSLTLSAEDVSLDLIHVEDAAAAFLHAFQLLEANASFEGSLSRHSVSSGRDTSSMELVTLFERLGNRSLHVIRTQKGSPSRRGKPWRGAALPGWIPKITLEQGIRRIICGDQK